MFITYPDPVEAVKNSDSGCASSDLREAGEIRSFDLLIRLVSQRKFISKVTATAMILAASLSLMLPNWYTATTKILAPQQNQSLASSLLGQLGTLGSLAGAASNLGATNPNAIYITMLRSRTLEDTLIRRFDLKATYRAKRMSDARKALERASTIMLGTKDNVITITVEDKDPRRAADLANSYVDELRGLTNTLAISEAAQRRAFFEQQLQQVKSKLAEAEQSLLTTQQQTGLIQLDTQAKAIIESDVRLKGEIAAKEIQLQMMHSVVTDRNPDLMLLEQELAAMKSQMASIEHKSAGPGDIQIGTGRVSEDGLEYVRKVREVKYYETMFELLARQFEAAKLDESRSAGVIQVLDRAVEPDRKSWPSRVLITLLITMLALIGSMLCVAVDQPLKDRFISLIHSMKHTGIQ